MPLPSLWGILFAAQLERQIFKINISPSGVLPKN